MGIRIRTTDKELFNKLNSLKFTDEVIIRNKKQKQISRILNNVNKNGTVIRTQHIGNRVLLRKLKPLQFNMYYMKR